MISEQEKLCRTIEENPFLRDLVYSQKLASVSDRDRSYAIYSFTLGSRDPSAPALFITGGIHGLERIGAQLAWSLLKTTFDRLRWDTLLRQSLAHMKIVVVPLMNPVGYFNFTRCNGNGVDLMRNSPISANEKVPWLLGGQRYSNKLPWFMGQPLQLEPENEALLSFFKTELIHSKFMVAVDFHSGFGMRDRIWFPYAYTSKPFEGISQMHALTQLFEETHPYHIYQIEPQSKGYLINGDLWDYLYCLFRKENAEGIFLPLTLEMGSWNWVRKNPLQIFLKEGVFNPIKGHRIKRTYRRHHLLFDFLTKAIYSYRVWGASEQGQVERHHQLGLERWYE